MPYIPSVSVIFAVRLEDVQPTAFTRSLKYGMESGISLSGVSINVHRRVDIDIHIFPM